MNHWCDSWKNWCTWPEMSHLYTFNIYYNYEEGVERLLAQWLALCLFFNEENWETKHQVWLAKNISSSFCNIIIFSKLVEDNMLCSGFIQIKLTKWLYEIISYPLRNTLLRKCSLWTAQVLVIFTLATFFFKFYFLLFLMCNFKTICYYCIWICMIYIRGSSYIYIKR